MTDNYAVIGHPVAHSKSPQIHTHFAAQTGEDLCYTAILAPLDGFAATVRDFSASGGCGLNVTVPFKEEAFRLATRLSPRAQAAGAVNTLRFSGNEIFGDNPMVPVWYAISRKISTVRWLVGASCCWVLAARRAASSCRCSWETRRGW